MPGRTYTAGTGYRYGFNGKENDNEVKGAGNQIDFGARVYDPRIGRWFAVDPMRKLAPDETPYRFGHDNPILYKDPNGKWEEDGHYWTVYALGIAMGLSKTNAQAVAAKAEYYDHHVGADNSMTLHISHNNPRLGKAFGIGTWADADLQKSWHGLTGGRQSDVLNDAVGNVMRGDLNQLHKVGDAWAHSYIGDDGERTMWGKTTNWVPGLGRITLEHAFAGGHGNENADNISKRPIEYSSYLNSLVGIFNDKKFAYNSRVTNSKPDLAIFGYVQKNGGSKEANIFLLQSYIGLKTGTTNFNSENKSMIDKLKGYLNQQGIKYTESSASREVSAGASPNTGIPTSQAVTTYSINVTPEKKN
jgi:RHS repeat-associated protein